MRKLLLLAPAWLALSLISLAQDSATHDEQIHYREIETANRAIDRELSDLAQAIRGLDQSYRFRGVRGTGAWTAGSAFMDWESRGIPVGERRHITPPPELNLGCASSRHSALCDGRSPCGQTGCSNCQNPACSSCGKLKTASPCEQCGYAQSSFGPPRLLNLFCQQRRPWEPIPDGQLIPAAGWGVQFGAGHLYAEGAGSALVETCRPASRFAISVQLDIPQPTANFTPIVQFGDDWKTSNLCLGQLGSELRFRWKTDAPDAFGSEVHELNLGTLSPGPHNLGFRYSPGRLVVQIDGHSDVIRGVSGDLDNWIHTRLYLGSPLPNRRWNGTLYHVAVGDDVPAYTLATRAQSTIRAVPQGGGDEPKPTPASSDDQDVPPPPST
ncbi:MAG: hypothetical protein KDA90_01810 [Planctomycetaceae bacterium]|nr:hypothetical protein [Planctomycetaceae bacterium]